jgi:hypothetical protein
MALFDFEKISEIYEKAVQVGFAAKRSVLLAGLDEAYRANLEVVSSPGDQMLLDLRAMNSADRTVGTDIPLRIWLANAALLMAALPDEEVYFASLRDRTAAQRQPSPAETQQRAKTTLENLQAIAGKNVPLRESLIAANQELEEIARTVKLLVVYKGLHDILHEVQIYSLPLLTAMLRRGLATDEDWLMFQQQVSDLEFKHSRAFTEVRRLPPESSARIDEERWLDGLGNVHLALTGARESRSAELAGDSLVELRRLVRSKMFRLNLLLYDSARRLRIDVLIDRLRAFAGSLDMEDPRAGQLREAATQLLLLKSEIETLLNDHDGWQRIDEDLWSAEEDLVFGGYGEFALRSFSRLWPGMIERIARIAGPGTDPWYVQTRRHVEAFGAHCPMPATAPIAPAAIDDIRDFLKVTRDQFFMIDKELKARCDRLAEVADPIERLARLQ